MAEPEMFVHDTTIHFYRQPDGCLEIGQNDVEDHDDLVHIHEDLVPMFFEQLKEYIERTRP